jgi:hypothetical protein
MFSSHYLCKDDHIVIYMYYSWPPSREPGLHFDYSPSAKMVPVPNGPLSREKWLNIGLFRELLCKYLRDKICNGMQKINSSSLKSTLTVKEGHSEQSTMSMSLPFIQSRPSFRVWATSNILRSLLDNPRKISNYGFTGLPWVIQLVEMIR